MKIASLYQDTMREAKFKWRKFNREEKRKKGHGQDKIQIIYLKIIKKIFS